MRCAGDGRLTRGGRRHTRDGLSIGGRHRHTRHGLLIEERRRHTRDRYNHYICRRDVFCYRI